MTIKSSVWYPIPFKQKNKKQKIKRDLLECRNVLSSFTLTFLYFMFWSFETHCLNNYDKCLIFGPWSRRIGS